LKYQNSPTLNPNTAHRNLQISADFKTVRTSTHTQPYPDNSDRFDHYRVVICSEKFSSGRHYWEVDVINEVSWCLKKRGNTYTAVHNETETKLSVRDAPKRVGVHLDWEAGVLSFYSADSMSLLHRFRSTVQQNRRPADHLSSATAPRNL
uniref:B30.2/SPRY domain-containing protein n=1 Tax=Petromyzon marinus TaxID=7757 RepID=S4R609_PETMA